MSVIHRKSTARGGSAPELSPGASRKVSGSRVKFAQRPARNALESPGDAALPPQPEHEHFLGSRVRRIRIDKDWTLSELARRSGISVSTLSKVENHKISLAYDNIIKLANGLGVEVAELFAANALHVANSRRSIVRGSEGKLLSTPNYDYFYLGTDIVKKRMIPIYTRIKCHDIKEFGDFLQHSGEEFIYVLEGAVEVHTASYSPLVLRTGEGVYLDSTMPHAYISVGPDDALVLGVCSSPEEPSSRSSSRTFHE